MRRGSGEQPGAFCAEADWKHETQAGQTNCLKDVKNATSESTAAARPAWIFGEFANCTFT